jgi:Putative bacterial sensory transduction regulator
VSEWYADGDLAILERRIDEWLAAFQAEHDVVADVQRGEGDERRWYVRMRGVEKDFTTVWIVLGQRTVRYETYFMPAPEENHATLFEHLLRRNDRLIGAHFAIGLEDAVYLRGELPIAALDQGELDRVLGSLYAYVEQYFRPALHIGFASRFSSP